MEVWCTSNTAKLVSLDHLFPRPNITIFFTLLAVGVSFAWLGVEDPAHWKAGVALYILGRELLSLPKFDEPLA